MLTTISDALSKENLEVKKVLNKIQQQTVIDQKILIFHDTLKQWGDNDCFNSKSPELHKKLRLLFREIDKIYFITPTSLASRILTSLVEVTNKDVIDFDKARNIISDYRYIKEKVISMLFFCLYNFFNGFGITSKDLKNEQTENMDFYIHDTMFKMMKKSSRFNYVTLKSLLAGWLRIFHAKIEQLSPASRVYFLNNILRISLRNKNLYENISLLLFHMQYDLYFDNMMKTRKFNFSGTFSVCNIPDLEDEFFQLTNSLIRDSKIIEKPLLISQKLNYFKLFSFVFFEMWPRDDSSLKQYIIDIINLENKMRDEFLIAIIKSLIDNKPLSNIMSHFSQDWPPTNPLKYAIFNILHNWYFRKTGMLYIRKHYIPSFYLAGAVIFLRSFDKNKAVILILGMADEIIMRYMHHLGPSWTLNIFKKIFDRIDENFSEWEDHADKKKEKFSESLSEMGQLDFRSRQIDEFGFFSFIIIEIAHVLRGCIQEITKWNYIVHWIKFHWQSKLQSYLNTNDYQAESKNPHEYLEYLIGKKMYQLKEDEIIKSINYCIKMVPANFFVEIFESPQIETDKLSDIIILFNRRIPDNISQKNLELYVKFREVCTFQMIIENPDKRHECELNLLCAKYRQLFMEIKVSSKYITPEIVGNMFMEFLRIWSITGFHYPETISHFSELLVIIEDFDSENFNEICKAVLKSCSSFPSDKNERETLLKSQAFSTNKSYSKKVNMICQIFYWLIACKKNEDYVPHFRKFWELYHFNDTALMLPKVSTKNKISKTNMYMLLDQQIDAFHEYRKKNFSRKYRDMLSEKNMALRHVECISCYIGNAIRLNIGQFFYWKTLCELQTSSMNEYLNLFLAYLGNHMENFLAISSSDTKVLLQLKEKAEYKLCNPDNHIFFVEIKENILEPENFFLVYFYLLRVKDKFDYQEDFFVDFLYKVLDMVVNAFYLVNSPNILNNIYSGYEGAIKYFKSCLELLLFASLTQNRICYVIYVSCYIIGEIFEKEKFKFVALQIYIYLTSGGQTDYSLIENILEENDKDLVGIFSTLKKFLEKLG